MKKRSLVFSTLVFGIPAGAAAQFPPDSLHNIQVLPADMSPRDIIGFMRGFAQGLGVRCQYCHVGEEGADLSTFDFPSDEKATKEKARTMIRMVRNINAEYLGQLASRADPPVQVTCATCHNGVAVPQPLPAVLASKAEAEGADAAVVEYRRLRERYYGSASYDFSEGSLVAAGEAVVRSVGPEAAIALMQLNLEFFPNSVSTHVTLGQTYARAGDTDAALRHLERALELAPNQPQIQRMINQIRG